MTTLHWPHRVGFVLALVLASLILTDLVFRVVTGSPTPITDDAVDPLWLSVVVHLLLAVEFAALHVVLRAQGDAFASAGRVARVCRMILVWSTALLALGTLGGVVLAALGVDSGAAFGVFSALASVALAATLLAAIVLGLSQLRNNRLGVGARVLALIIPVILITAALGLVVPDLASPALLTATLLLGLSLVGYERHGAPASVGAR